MLTLAVEFIQSVQLVCFAVVFVCMSLNDRQNRSLRWLAYSYVFGTLVSLLTLSHSLPLWLSTGVGFEAPLVAYAAANVGIVYFVQRGHWTRLASLLLLAITLPPLILWSNNTDTIRSTAVVDLSLVIQISLSAWLLFTTRDADTHWPRRLMGSLLTLYALIAAIRAALLIGTHHWPAEVSARIEYACAFVYVIALSVLPISYIWMLNARLNANLSRQSILDPLTGLLNRRGLERQGDRLLLRYLRTGTNFAVVVCDLDHFKQLNDRFGHAAGDTVLCSTVELLGGLLRLGDIIGRIGGEEFVLLLPDTDADGALRLIERLRTTLEFYRFELNTLTTTRQDQSELQGTSTAEATITASFGLSVTANRTNLTWTRLLEEADTALYTAKRAGRNRVELYADPLSDQIGSTMTA